MKFLSRKFLVAVVGGLLVTLDGLGAINMSDANTQLLVQIGLGYILGEGAVDALRVFKADK